MLQASQDCALDEMAFVRFCVREVLALMYAASGVALAHGGFVSHGLGESVRKCTPPPS